MKLALCQNAIRKSCSVNDDAGSENLSNIVTVVLLNLNTRRIGRPLASDHECPIASIKAKMMDSEYA